MTRRSILVTSADCTMAVAEAVMPTKRTVSPTPMAEDRPRRASSTATGTGVVGGVSRAMVGGQTQRWCTRRRRYRTTMSQTLHRYSCYSPGVSPIMAGSYVMMA